MAVLVVAGLLAATTPAVAAPLLGAVGSLVSGARDSSAGGSATGAGTSAGGSASGRDVDAGVTVDTGALAAKATSLVGQTSALVNDLPRIADLAGGLAQGQLALNQLLAGLAGGAAVAAPVVQAKATSASAAAITSLQTRAQATAAAAAAFDPATAQAEALGIIGDLQAQATGEVAGLLPLALTTGLQVVQNVVTPVCSLAAVPSSLVPGLGVDTTRLYTAAAPLIQQTDQATNKLLRDTYAKVYDQTLSSAASIPNVGPVLSALLLLLKYDWTTTYTPPGSSTPIVTTTKALMNVPTPIDVDNDGLFDLCGTTSFALSGSGTSISGLKLTQTVTKLPLAKAVLPVQIGGGLLNVISLGYDARESTAPVIYTTSATLDAASGARLNLDNSYAVHRGKNLTIPPLTLQTLNLATGALPTLLPLLTDAPKPIVTQELCIASCATLAIRDRFDDVPPTTRVEGPLASTGVNVTYRAPSPSDGYRHTFSVGTSSSLGAEAGRDRVAPEVTVPVRSTAPTEFSSCLSLTDGSCAGTDPAKASLAFRASAPTFAEQNVAVNGAPAATCPAVVSLGATSHLTGTAARAAFTPATTTAGSGVVLLDSAGAPLEGCLAAGSVLGLVGLPNLTLPSGFAASARKATYSASSAFGLLSGTPIATKAGSITCPTGTTATYPSLSPFGTVNLQPVVCSLPPVNTAVPELAGQALVDATLTAGNGTWTPGAPNAPTFAKQWFRCDAAGAGCAAIAGATGDSYVLDYGSYPNQPTDFGKRFKVTVTATNLDGTASATSALTDVVALPPAPVIATAPVLGSNRKVGVATTTTNGTYTNGATTFTYQWQRCDADGTPSSCADLPGATSSSYVVQAADKGRTIRAGVVGTNHGGSAPVNYSSTALIPPDPVNTVAPVVKNGPASAVGASVATGDNLAATSGTWTYATEPFTYRWQRCDAAGTASSCADIPSATSATYQLQHPADSGKTVRVVVRAEGLNGSATAASGTTGVVLFNDLQAKPVTQIPDGTVLATAPGAGSSVYVGGDFDTVGAPTGGSGLVTDSGTGSTVTLASQTAGATNGGVLATVPDGAGGYFLGGSFTQVKGIQCPGLARLRSDGTVDQNYCYSGLTGTVRALARVANGPSAVLAVGGQFSLNGRNNLMFVDPAATASPVFDSAGDPNGPVQALAVNRNNNNTVYVGGRFSQLGGQSAGLLGAETLTWDSNGRLTTAARNGWLAGVCTAVPSGTSACADPVATVNTLGWAAVGSGGVVLVGGRFANGYRMNFAGTPTNSAERASALVVGDSGNALIGAWNPKIAGGAQTVNAIAPGPGSGLSNVPIYLGGDFTSVNNVAMRNLAEFGMSVLFGSANSGTSNNSGPMTSWTPNPNGPVTSLAWAGTNSAASLIVGGEFTTISSGPTASATTLVRHRLAKIVLGSSTSTTLPIVDATWDPNAGRAVRTVSRDPALGTVTVGGDFVVLGGATRNNAAEFDPTTGVTGWNPDVDGVVRSLAFGNGTVYLGGQFTKVGGAARANLGAVDTNGAVTSWDPGTDGPVHALVRRGTDVIVGGAFTKLGTSSRSNLGAVDASGAVTSWAPSVDGVVRSLAVSGSTVYLGGAFTQVAGAARANAAAVTSAGAATAFAPDPNGTVFALAVNGAGVYLGGAFTQVGATARDHVALVDPSTGVLDSWNPGVNGDVLTVYLVGSQVFVGGTFTEAGTKARSNLAALDAGSNTAQAFDPKANGTVRTLSRTAGGSIVVGGSFAIIAGQAAPALGFFGG